MADALPHLAVFLALLALAWTSRGRRPWISLGLAWAALHLVLFNGVFSRLDVVNERLFYWGDWALFLMVAAELETMLSRPLARATLLLTALALGAATVARNQVYRSEMALWEATAAQSPGKARVFNNLGYAYALAGRGEAAEAAFLRALRLQPDYGKAAGNLRDLRQGRFKGP